jgi:hypothetical protein
MIMYSGFISNQVRSWPVSIPSAKTGNAPQADPSPFPGFLFLQVYFIHRLEISDLSSG